MKIVAKIKITSLLLIVSSIFIPIAIILEFLLMELNHTFFAILATEIGCITAITILAILMLIKVENRLEEFVKSIKPSNKTVVFNKKNDEMDILQKSFCDMQHNIKGLSQVAKLDVIDTQTGLYTHSHFHEVLDAELKNSQNLSVVLIDIDHFKKYNTSKGYKSGDNILKQISNILKNLINDKGLLFRYGGEEIAGIFKNLSKEEVYNLLENIRNIVEKDNSIGLTFSCGIAGYPVDAQDKDDLLKHTGEALYMAKYGGRNAVCIYTP